MLLPIVFTALGWAIGRAPGTGTVICVLVVGPVLGVVLDALPTHEAMAPRLAHFVVGFLLVAAGITAVIIAEIGPGPAELVMLAIHDRGDRQSTRLTSSHYRAERLHSSACKIKSTLQPITHITT